jgi:GMP reductase
MRLINDTKLDFRDVLILPKRSTLSSRSEVSLERTYNFKNSKQSWTGVPIMVANMDTTGTFEMANALMKHKVITCIHKHYTIEEWSSFLATLSDDDFNYFTVSIGTSKRDFEFLHTLLKLDSRIKFILLDVANGYSVAFINRVQDIVDVYPDKILAAGNVVTAEMVEELILNGVDIVKSGIGNGSVCTTRIKTGVGYPQLSAVIECADATHGLNGRLISDGGCCNSGDIAKAFGAGADFVMLGGMMAGHDESGGTYVEENGKKYKEFYGMSSSTAMDKHNGGVAKYRASEGKRVLIDYKGSINNTILDILGGLRSTCTYVGAKELKELSKRTTFIKVNRQSNEVYGKN